MYVRRVRNRVRGDAVDKPKVVLGVSGGIAAYKACELLRRLTESGHDVRVVPTESALHFVGAATWSALSGHPVSTEVWNDVHEVPHVRIGQHADLVVVAPATADMLAKAAHGLADDLLTNTLLTARCPVVFAPAMHTEMWEHPATQENVATLRRRGAVVIEPAVGRLTGVDTGKGRLPDPGEIFEVCRRVLARGTAAPDLAGRHVVISAGGTREPLDPVRYLGNRSSGKQGYALARTAVARGARVTLVEANTGLPDPSGADVVHTGTAIQLREAVLKAAQDADVVVMAAAVADFRPARYVTGKIKKKDGQEPAPSPSSATRTSSPRSPPSAPRPARSSSDSPPRPTTYWPTAARSCAARAATCWWSTRWGSARPSAPRRTRPWCSPPTERRLRCRTGPRRRSPTRCGTS